MTKIMATDLEQPWKMHPMEAGFMGFVLGMVFMASVMQWHSNAAERHAHECAVTSIGTDSAIEACYAKFHVPFPGY